MTGSKTSDEVELQNRPASDSGESEDESEVLDESPCGRWQKRNERVNQRDAPGIDCTYLAMDTEEGVEVVWNEVRISEKKASKSQVYILPYWVILQAFIEIYLFFLLF